MTKACTCNNVAHRDRSAATPNGNPGHKYGARYEENYLQRTLTAGGAIVICRDCAADCHQEG